MAGILAHARLGVFAFERCDCHRNGRTDRLDEHYGSDRVRDSRRLQCVVSRLRPRQRVALRAQYRLSPDERGGEVVVILVLAIIAVQLVGGIVKGMKMIEQRRQQQSQHLESGPVIGSRSSLPSTTRPSMTAFPAR